MASKPRSCWGHVHGRRELTSVPSNFRRPLALSIKFATPHPYSRSRRAECLRNAPPLKARAHTCVSGRHRSSASVAASGARHPPVRRMLPASGCPYFTINQRPIRNAEHGFDFSHSPSRPPLGGVLGLFFVRVVWVGVVLVYGVETLAVVFDHHQVSLFCSVLASNPPQAPQDIALVHFLAVAASRSPPLWAGSSSTSAFDVSPAQARRIISARNAEATDPVGNRRRRVLGAGGIGLRALQPRENFFQLLAGLCRTDYWWHEITGLACRLSTARESSGRSTEK